ncbi:Uncharacterised protein [Mycobacterium tuberculosis]|nr:Uncharacterised protein [Mycobacterium tuberculosis]
MVLVTVRIAIGSNRTMASRRCRSGHKIRTITTLSATTLNTPLRKFAPACLPNRRAKPAAGEILLNFGLNGSVENTSRCWIRLLPMPAISNSRNGTPRTPISISSIWLSSDSRPGPSTRI